MLTFTETATAAIEEITAAREPSDTNGLRIITTTDTSDGPALAATLAQAPAPEDKVIELPHARVYLEPEAADMLADKVLDAAIADDGSVSFRITPRFTPPA